MELPAEAAKILKRQTDTAISEGVDYRIAKPRTEKWLAENIMNPFKGWYDRNPITQAQAKKAMAQYKKTRQALEKSAAQYLKHPDLNTLLTSYTEEVKQYTELFNQLDAKKGFIEPEEREEIADILSRLLQDSLNNSGSGITVTQWMEQFDQLRDF